jgi:PII-like signaling protein
MRLPIAVVPRLDRSAALDQDASVLTSYFRDRHHAGARSLGGALIDLYGRGPAAASVLLRGVGGYGFGQRPASDRTLPLPEDPMLTAVAVDAGPCIDAALDEMVGLTRLPVTTVERAWLLSGEIEPLLISDSSAEATRLTIYCCHADRVYEVPAFETACELLYRRGIAGATVLSGIDGTVGGRRHRAQFLRHDADTPLMVVAVGSGERIGTVLPELGGLFRHPLMTVATVGLCKRDGQLISRPGRMPGADAVTRFAGMAPRIKLTVYTSEAARYDGQPTHRAMIRRLRSVGTSGATSQRGIWGFHGEHAPHGGHFPLHGRHVPVVTTVIDTPGRIAVAFDIIDALTPGRGLVTAETVLTRQPSGVSSGHSFLARADSRQRDSSSKACSRTIQLLTINVGRSFPHTHSPRNRKSPPGRSHRKPLVTNTAVRNTATDDTTWYRLYRLSPGIYS